jgi:Asp-tRNA(Asn)/Glu-tRNA(Gln) amidotransferase A subunit family amidase
LKKGREKMSTPKFDIIDATIADIHSAYAAGALTARKLVETYLDRIEKFDKGGPNINSIISTNPEALAQADALDAAYEKLGPVGPLHGIPLAMKDQGDVKEMPTTMGSVLFRDHKPGRDSFVAARLREAGAIFIAKTTLGEMGAGDTHGSLFGSTRCVYDFKRTAGGSSGGSGAAASSNFCAAAIGQEGFASIRRPSIWNGIAGMRPSAGLVSRGGVYAGWPSIYGSLGPMARTVEDCAKLLDVMAGYDENDPITARGVGNQADSYEKALSTDGLRGKRIGILRTVMGYHSEPESEDFKQVDTLFDTAISDLEAKGAQLVDPIELPNMNEFLDKRAWDSAGDEEAFRSYCAGSSRPPFATMDEAKASPLFREVTNGVSTRWANRSTPEEYAAYQKARGDFETVFLNTMASQRLDAIVHKAVEHTPTLISDGIAPPYVDQKGAPHLNTFLIFVPSVVVPAGYTETGLPAGITFLGRPYSDAEMLNLAYAYEQATKHRKIPDF